MSKLIHRSKPRITAALFVLLIACSSPASAWNRPRPTAPLELATRPETSNQDGAALLVTLAEASEATALTPASTAAALLVAGPEATRALFALLENPTAESTVADGLVPVQRQRVRSALRGIGMVVVDIALLPQLAPEDRAHACSVALEVLGASDAGTSSPWLEQLLQSTRTRTLSRSVVARIERTVARLVVDPGLTSSQLAAWIRAGGTELGTAVVDGAESADALMKLVGCLRTTTGAEGVILNRLAGMIQRGAPVGAEFTSEAVLPFLGSRSAFERREAAAVIGMVGDRRHVSALISGLDDREHMVRTSALKALKALTGMTISGDPGRWKLWYEDQETWWEGEGSRMVASITSVERSNLVSILKDVGTRRLYRREIAAQLVQLLDRQHADEVLVAVASLATLRDPTTLDAILELRQHPNPMVRSSVEDAVVAFRHAGIKSRQIKPLPTH